MWACELMMGGYKYYLPVFAWVGGDWGVLNCFLRDLTKLFVVPAPMSTGVPLSTQWGPQGYFYPIQIAQYGLSHYSKNLTEKPPHIEVYETAEDKDKSSRPTDWTVPKGCSVATVSDKSRFTNVKQFVAPGGLL